MCYGSKRVDRTISQEQSNRDIDFGDNQPEQSSPPVVGYDPAYIGSSSQSRTAVLERPQQTGTRVGPLQRFPGTGNIAFSPAPLNASKSMLQAMKEASTLGLDPTTEQARRLNNLFRFHEGLGLSQQEGEAVASATLYLKGQAYQVGEELQNVGIGTLSKMPVDRLAALAAASLSYAFDVTVWPTAQLNAIADTRSDRLKAAEQDMGFKLGQEVSKKGGSGRLGQIIGFARIDTHTEKGKRMAVVMAPFSMGVPFDATHHTLLYSADELVPFKAEQKKPVSSGC